jgi:hypothetical protein
MFVLRLNTGGLDVLFAGSLSFLGGLLRAHAAIATVIADAGRIVIVVDDRGVVGVVNDGHIHVVYGAIVGETPAFPASAEIANSDITESIIYAAIKSDVRSPITGVPEIAPVTPAPVAGGPQKPYTWRQHPSAGHPIIIIVAISPIAGRPDIALPGA